MMKSKPKIRSEMHGYIETFCGVCQRHFAIQTQSEWPVGVFARAKEKLAWLGIHKNHESPDQLPPLPIKKKRGK